VVRYSNKQAEAEHRTAFRPKTDAALVVRSLSWKHSRFHPPPG
jgi:hypothetical protein